jgi:hypothetical protein
MPRYEFDMPDGSKKIGEGDSPEAAWRALNNLPPSGMPTRLEDDSYQKFGTGVGRGLTAAATTVAPYLPGSNYEMARAVGKAQSRRGIPDPIGSMEAFGQGGAAEGPERWGKVAGEIAPTLLAPELLELGAVRGSMLGGGLGGVMTPAPTPTARSQNAAAGTTAGAAVGGVRTAINAIPPRYRWLLSLVPAATAVEILRRLGVHSWAAEIPAFGLGGGLGALAGRATSKVPAATAGSVGAHVRQLEDDSDGR